MAFQTCYKGDGSKDIIDISKILAKKQNVAPCPEKVSEQYLEHFVDPQSRYDRYDTLEIAGVVFDDQIPYEVHCGSDYEVPWNVDLEVPWNDHLCRGMKINEVESFALRLLGPN